MADTPEAPGLIDRTLRNLRGAWRDIAQSARGVISAEAGFSAELSGTEREKLRVRMQDCLDGRGGDVSARARAAELGRIYLGLGPSGREGFLRLLATGFDIDHERVAAAAAQVLGADDAEGRRGAERALRLALTAPRRRLLTQFNALPEGVKFLVDLRADLLAVAGGDPDLGALDEDLRELLASWFDVGFLELRRITWDAPASLLEKLSRYEAVHAVRSWDDLKNRLDSDRRCFAFFHPHMPDEPLIFVEVALVSGLAGNIQALLDESAPVGDPRRADTAIFYSISNAQKGLVGISFGNFLIKRVVGQLQGEFPRLRRFATLSPMPGFRRWLDERFAEGTPGMLAAGERKALASAVGGNATAASKGLLKTLLADDRWVARPELAAALRAPVLRLAADYLLHARRDDGAARDPVAHFHLSNGARIERLNWLADAGPRGLRQSLGVMVNYVYDLATIEGNHEAYTGERRVAVAPGKRALF